MPIFGFTWEFPVALTTVIAFEAWRYFPLSFLFILARMQSFSSEIYEAAKMDGATPLQQFRRISLPQLAGILGVLFLLRFIWTFNKFDDIFLLTGGRRERARSWWIFTSRPLLSPISGPGQRWRWSSSLCCFSLRSLSLLLRPRMKRDAPRAPPYGSPLPPTSLPPT